MRVRLWALYLVTAGAALVVAGAEPVAEPPVIALVDQALTAARSIKGRHLGSQQELLLAEIASTLVAAGDLTRGADVLVRLPDPRLRVETWLRVARAQNQAGHRHAAAMACRRVLGITRDDVKRWGPELGATVAELAAAGEYDEALATAKLLERDAPSTAALAYRGLAASLARAGDLSTVRELERDLAGGSYLVSAMAEGVAVGQAAAGDIPGALRTIKAMPARSARAMLLIEVAGVQVQRQDLAGAKTNLARAREFFAPLEQNPQRLLSAKDTGLRAIVSVEVAAGDLAAARRTADEIVHHERRAVALVEVALALAARGDQDGATARLKEALHIARQIEFRAARAAAFQQIGQAQARTGDLRGALRTAKQANADILTSDIYEAVGVAHAAAGDLVGALAAAQQTPGGLVMQARVLQAVTRSLVERGADQPALTMARKQDHPLLRSRALLGIAQGRLEREAPPPR
ncbi:hypothetical protein HQ590_16895 [bacterium]|nr:hypothetical protein [bacterium]